MASDKGLDTSDVLALLQRPRSSSSPSPVIDVEASDYNARYDRCANCRSITPCLLTFRGRLDWAPEIAEQGPLREKVEQLRRETGKGTILLCTSCVARISKESPRETEQFGQLTLAFT